MPEAKHYHRLDGLGITIKHELVRVLKEDRISVEAKRSITRLLAKPDWPVVSSEVLQIERAIALFERIGTENAIQLLEDLSKGAPTAHLTISAKEALARCQTRHPLSDRERTRSR